MYKKILQLVFIALFITIFISSFIIICPCKISDKNLTSIEEHDKEKSLLHKSDEFGVLNIYNLTINKNSAEIGENITVSTVYSLLCNPGYRRDYGMIGIYTPTWFEYENSLINGVEYYNVTETIRISPNRFNGSNVCNGMIRIKISNISNPMDYIIYENFTIDDLILSKAQLNYTLIEQAPLITFSDDLLNLSLFIYNEHAENYLFSNGLININVSNEGTSLNFSKYTDSKGFLNFTVNCSDIGAGNYTIRFENNETSDYAPTFYFYQLEVLDKNKCINCTLLNSNNIYTWVDYDIANNSKAFFSIQSDFEANISYSSNFSSGQCSKIGDLYLATLNSPSRAGVYYVNFSAQPIMNGKTIEFQQIIEVKKRPTELKATFFRYENQTNISYHINITDKLVDSLIQTNQSFSIFVDYNYSSWNLGSLIPNPDENTLFIWEPPIRIQEAYLSFKFRFNATPVYESTSLRENITITKLEYSGPLQEFASKNLTIKAGLFALNGTPLPNHKLKILINDESFNLTTDLNGEVHFSVITPSYATKVRIEFQFLGSGSILPSNLILNINIELDLLQQIWDSIGYILLGIGIAIMSLIYVKKILSKRNLATLGVK